MGLIADGKVMIEVGLNEWATKAQNPNVPYGIDEVIASGAACASAGAAILHFHSRADDGAQLWTAAEVYRAEMEGISAQADVIMYPSYNADFVHIWDLLDNPPIGAPMDIVPFDVYQGVGNVLWDDSTKSFRKRFSDIQALSEHKGACPPELMEMLRRRVLPTGLRLGAGRVALDSPRHRGRLDTGAGVAQVVHAGRAGEGRRADTERDRCAAHARDTRHGAVDRAVRHDEPTGHGSVASARDATRHAHPGRNWRQPAGIPDRDQRGARRMGRPAGV